MTPETAIKRQVKQYLQYRGWFVFPVLQGLGAYKGISDLIALKRGRVAFIEVKRPGGRQSEHQKSFQENIEAQGGEYWLVRSVDDVMLRDGG